MADDSSSPGLEYVLKSILDAKGFEDMQINIRRVGDESQKVKTPVNAFEEAVKGLGVQLLAATGIMIGVGEALAFMKESIHAAVEESRYLDQMRAANETLAGATADSRAANEDWILSVEKASGKTKEQLIPSYVRLAAVTKDVNEAQRLTQIAAGAAAQGFGEVGQITQALIRYYETGKTQTRGFGAVIKSLTSEAKDLGEGFQKLEKQFGDAGAATDNLGLKVDRSRVSWHEMMVVIGALGTQFIDFLAPALRVASIALGGIISFANYLTLPLRATVVIIQQLATALGALIAFDFSGAAKALVEVPAKLLKVSEDAMDFNVKVMGGIDRAWSDAAGGLNKSQAKIKGGVVDVDSALKDLQTDYDLMALKAKNASKSVVDGVAAELAIYKMMAADPAFLKATGGDEGEKQKLIAKIIALEKSLTEATKAEVRKREEAVKESYDEEIKMVEINAVSKYDELNQEIAIYQRMASDLAIGRKAQTDATLKARDAEKALNAEIGKEVETLQKKGRTLKEFLDQADQDRIDQANKDKKAADEKFKLEDSNYKKMHSLDDNYLKGYVQFLQAQLVAFAGSENEMLRIKADLLQAQAQLVKKEAETEMQVRQMLEQDALGLMGSVFGKSKAYAVAQATVKTYEGAAGALAWEPQGWWNFAAAALVIATGLADVAQIISTEPGTGGGGGFDNPRNDLAAIAGGTRWADDMIRYYGQGASLGFSQGMARAGGGDSVTNVTNRNGGNSSINITINGGVLGSDDAAARALVKKLVPHLNRYDQRRTLQ